MVVAVVKVEAAETGATATARTQTAENTAAIAILFCKVWYP
jgi:hypothetical protein